MTAEDIRVLDGRIYRDIEVASADKDGVVIRHGPYHVGVKLLWSWLTPEQRAKMEPIAAICRLKARLEELTRKESHIRAQIADARQAQARENNARTKGPRYVFNNAPSAGSVSQMNDRLKQIAKEKRQIQQTLNTSSQ